MANEALIQGAAKAYGSGIGNAAAMRQANINRQQPNFGAAAAQAAMQAQAGPSAEEQMKMTAMERDEARKDAALQAEIERNNLKMQQEMALADAKAASSL